MLKKSKKAKDELHIPEGAMVDTMVLIHAVKVPDKSRIKAELFDQVEERHRSYRWLLTKMEPVRVSATTWTEFLRFHPKTEREKLRKLTSSIDVMSIDEEVAELAAELLHKHFGMPGVCPKCLSHTEERASPCRQCNMIKAPRQHSIDALNVACAAVNGVPVFYSEEKVGVPKLVSLLSDAHRFEVRAPPCVDGALFDAVRGKRSS